MISIVIPTRNEPLVQDLITKLQDTINPITKDYEILAVDKSDDDTPSRMSRLGVRVIAQNSSGLGGAIIEGLQAAKGDPIIIMDADLSHDPEHIPTFLKKYSEGYDIIIGSRRITGGGIIGWGVYRKTVSYIGNVLGRWFAGIKVSDLTSGYRLYRRKVIETLDFKQLKSSGYAFQMEILAIAGSKGFQIGTVPIIFHERQEGKSKLSKNDIMEFFLTALRLGFRRLITVF